MDTIHSRIHAARKSKNLSMEQLAELCGVKSWQTVQQWENGKTAPSRKRLELVAHALGVSSNWLVTGNGPATLTDVQSAGFVNFKSVALVGFKVPLISWVRAGTWTDIEDLYQPGEADEWVNPISSSPGKASFALTIEGDSMTGGSNGVGFPQGSTIIVDPERSPQAGDYVVAKDVVTQQATFKKLTTDGGRWFLKPLNPAYPTIEIDDPAMRVIGVAIELILSRKL